jgi:replicative superfamily II helicase
MARDARLELEAFLRDEIGDLRRLLINEAITPSEKALLLIALEVSELRKTVAELVASGSAVHHADRATADVN